MHRERSRTGRNPSGVVIAILPVLPPTGTVAVTCVPEFTVTVLAVTPPKGTLLVCASPLPVIVTPVPTGSEGGVNDVIAGWWILKTLVMRERSRAGSSGCRCRGCDLLNRHELTPLRWIVRIGSATIAEVVRRKPQAQNFSFASY